MDNTIEINTNRVSLSDISKEELQKEFNCLKKLHSLAEAEIETKNQQLYDCNRELSKVRALEDYYLHEIQSLQSNEDASLKKWEQKKQQLEETISYLKQSYGEQIESLQQEIATKNAQIEDCHPKALVINNDEVIHDDLINENDNLKSTITLMYEKNIQLDECSKLFEKRIVEMEETIRNLQTEIVSLKENYNHKKGQVSEANRLIETLQEDLILTKNDLDVLKSKPLEKGSQGNSLFAEVDERRLHLQKSMLDMKKQYIEMKRENGHLLTKVTALHCENAKLCQRWDDEIKEREFENIKLDEAYMSRINDLESLVTMYETQILEKSTISSENIAKTGEIEFIENMIANKNKEINKLLKQRNKDSLSHMILSDQLKNAKAEIRKWRANTAQLECQVGQLQNDIDELKLERTHIKFEEPDDVNTVVSVPKYKSAMKQTTNHLKDLNTNSFESDAEEMNLSKYENMSVLKMEDCTNKENLKSCIVDTDEKASQKSVKFSVNTLEPKVTDRNRLRKGGRIIESKSILIPKLKK